MKLRLVITDRILEKLLEKHNVTRSEVVQCFSNKIGKLLKEQREQHLTDPPTMWFISETDTGRELKIAYIRENDVIFLKSAFEPDDEERRIYKKYAL